MPLIKRYPNRKLYNTTTKEYITLEKIAELIRMGDEIHVVDHATGEDLTSLTLTQVLFDQVKQQAGFLPKTVLTGLIQAGGRQIAAVQRVLATTLGWRKHTEDEIKRRIQVLVKQGGLSADEGQSLLDKMLSLDEQPEEPDLDPAMMERILNERGVATRNELRSLMEQIEELASRLEDIQ